MRVCLASARGLFGGWLMAMTMPLLHSPHLAAAWSATGLSPHIRIGLAVLELGGAALFAFEATLAAGMALLMTAFIVAAAVHVHQQEVPWWLLVYAAATVLLWYQTRRARRAQWCH